MSCSVADGGWPLSPVFGVLAVVALDDSGGTVHASPGVDALADLDRVADAVESDDIADAEKPDVLGSLVHPDDAASVAAAVVDVTDGAATTRRVTFRSRSDTDRRIELVLSGIPDGGGGRDGGGEDGGGEGDGEGSRDAGGDAAAVGVLTDATDLERDRQAIAGLGDLLEAVLRASTRDDLARAFLRWGRRLPDTGFRVYRYDTDVGGLVAVEPRDAVDTAERGGETAGEDGAGDENVEGLEDTESDTERPPGAVLDVYRTGSPAVVAGAETDRRRVALPLGDHGVLVAETTADGLPDDALVGAFAPLGSLLSLGLDRLRYADVLRVTGEAAREAHADHRRLQKLANTVRRAEDRILRADTAEAVHEALCEELTATDLFTFAWVGEIDFQDGRLVPQARAGEGRPYVDRIDLDTSADQAPPAVAAAAARERRHVPAVAGGIETEPWRREALACGFQSVMAVPIGDNEGLLGTLSVFTREAGGFDDDTRLALGHLGAVAGYAINALELRRAFFGATSVEVKLHVPTTDTALSRYAREVGAQLDVLSVVPGDEGASRLFFTVDRSPEAVLAAGQETPGVGTVTHHPERADVPVFETTITDQALLRAVSSHGAILTEASADAEGLWLTVKLGQNVEVRTYVEAVQSEFPETEIVARRIREEPVEASHRLRADYEEQLSERQREVFEAAYFGGYFNWPRDRTGSEIASSLGIAQPTFSRHLRAAERKLAALLFENAA